MCLRVILIIKKMLLSIPETVWLRLIDYLGFPGLCKLREVNKTIRDKIDYDIFFLYKRVEGKQDTELSKYSGYTTPDDYRSRIMICIVALYSINMTNVYSKTSDRITNNNCNGGNNSLTFNFKMNKELKFLENKLDKSAALIEKRKWKNIHKEIKRFKKTDKRS